MIDHNLLIFLAESSDKMSEISKRLLIALAIVGIILMLAIGYLVKLIKYVLKVQGDYVDETMYTVLEAKIIKDSKTFRKESWRKNRIKFYFDARIPMLVLISTCILIVFYTICAYDYNGKTLSWAFIHKINSDMMCKLYWPTQKFFGLTLASDWPIVVKPAIWHFNQFQGWITYIFDLLMIYCFIHLMVCTCAFISRNIRTITVANRYFKKDIDQLKNMQEQQKAQQPPVPEPSEELEDYLYKGKR